MAETRLDNGVRILSEHIAGMRSVALGVWIRQGGAHEPPDQIGVSHLLEHMVFKGTEKRSALEIADALEALGGGLDAYTSREHTSYQARVLDEHMPVALDVLADMVLQPTLHREDLALEREVVLEEIAQVEDTPDDLVFELHGDRLWGSHPYGRPILGSTESVTAMQADTLQELHRSRYVGENLIVAAAGNVQHDDLVERVGSYFSDVSSGQRNEIVTPVETTARGIASVHRDSAQSHIVFGTNTPGHAHADRYPLVLISSALGGGMSSRLFQRVREEMGLCYSIFTFQSFYRSGGLLGVYVGTRPGTADQASDAVREELERVSREGLGPGGLDRIKRQVSGQVMLSLESTGPRLHRLASFALHDQPMRPLDDVLEKIAAVTEDDILRVAGQYVTPAAHFELRLGPTPTAAA
ncbi:MAG: pitrilysin family protein [Gemmatimonadota bacterium]